MRLCSPLKKTSYEARKLVIGLAFFFAVLFLGSLVFMFVISFLFLIVNIALTTSQKVYRRMGIHRVFVFLLCNFNNHWIRRLHSPNFFRSCYCYSIRFLWSWNYFIFTYKSIPVICNQNKGFNRFCKQNSLQFK